MRRIREAPAHRKLSRPTRSARRDRRALISSRFCVTKQTAPPRCDDPGEQLPELRPPLGVERGRRLVEEQNGRRAEQREREVQPLALADRELGRRPVGKFRRRGRRRRRARRRGRGSRAASACRRARDAEAPSRRRPCARRRRSTDRAPRRGSRAASTCRRRSGRRGRPSRPPTRSRSLGSSAVRLPESARDAPSREQRGREQLRLGHGG